MPVALYVNRTARVRIQEISGRVTAADFSMLLRFYATHREIANMDVISFIDSDAELAVTAEDMITLRRGLAALQERVKPAVVLRSAWICPNIGAWPVLEQWLNERHSRDGMATEVVLVSDLDAVDSLFESDEVELVRHRIGFEMLAAFAADNPGST